MEPSEAGRAEDDGAADPPRAAARPEHIPVLDGLRGLAAGIVVVSHAAYLNFLPKMLGSRIGAEGVMLFFLLSGFLMAHLYLREPFSRAGAAAYARHRMGRVAPLFIAVVVVSFAVFSLWRAPWIYPVGLRQLVENLTFVRGGGVLWSVPVEVQFYAVFALLWWMRGRGRLWVGLALVEAVAIALAVAAAALRGAGGYVLETLPFWCHLFLGGVVLAMMRGRQPATPAALSRPTVLAAFGWIAVVFFVITLPGLRPFERLPAIEDSLDPISTLATVFLFVCALAGAGPLRALAAPLWRWLGGVSYGIYLLHLPVLLALASVVRPAGGLAGLAEFMVAVALILPAAWASHRFFETPLRRLIAAGVRGPAAAPRPATS